MFYIQAKFEFDYLDYEKQLLRLISRKEHNGLVINNSSQSLFLFVDKHLLQVSSLICSKESQFRSVLQGQAVASMYSPNSHANSAEKFLVTHRIDYSSSLI